ncbi:LAME_0B01772g1_1 [Lachancea meyersii CBS 8951]|uniref:DNA polymerase gamma n=1 Tax=Lachancea meyersii CBS 8951 TaxID=1266667 RepID=A0A1G4IT63_9SACH|nr:LAME_0B01772g1_1 [Lachancea meyersii CBS 8951]
MQATLKRVVSDCRVWRKVRFYSVEEKPRINAVGIQHLGKHLHNQVFGAEKSNGVVPELTVKEKQLLTRLSRQFLKKHGLLGKKTAISNPISFDLPLLQGNSLDEHFQKLGHYASEPFLSKARNKFTELPPKPKSWLRKAGWTRYTSSGEHQPVAFPCEQTIVFDVETLYKISPYPTLAVAVSEKAWYCWCSPFICGESDDPTHLIPLDTLNQTRLVIGHNVGYDRARVLEEYNCQESKAFFLDTMSLHVASSGMCSRQRPQWMQRQKAQKLNNDEDIGTETISGSEEEEPWTNVSALNSLEDVALLHCGIKLDKTQRDAFSTLDKNDIIDNFNPMVDYCAMDVEATSKVFDVVFPLFLLKCPHPVSFGALRLLSTSILTTKDSDWKKYIAQSENHYQQSKQSIEKKIVTIIEEVVKLKDDEDAFTKDPWLNQLDWTLKKLRLTKKGVPAKGQKLPGFPEWYRQLFPSKDSEAPVITIRNRTIPLFFKLSWEGEPVLWTDTSGWCFAAPNHRIEEMKEKNYVTADPVDVAKPGYQLFKIPHPNGPQYNCTTLLSKPYVQYFEKGVLTSSSDLAQEALKINSSCSYWISARERVMSQFLVSSKQFPAQFKDLGRKPFSDSSVSIILPAVIPMGTVTRRSVENTWLTASNAKVNRIGSELKAQIQAPPGYAFVGADVDSEELWIASLVSDSVFNIHGGTPIGWMCLEGSKSEGTDLHSKTAQILKCSRNEAKIFNYGRIYGAGVKFATQLLKKFNPNLSDVETKEMAEKLYGSTKGLTKRSKIFKKFWYGGSESILFNKLEHIAEQDIPKTPVLGAGITYSLMKRNLGSNTFLPSRINWAIQSSGVDYLHLLCCSMNYLIKKYEIEARLCISIHDEIRYLTAEKDKYRTAMALQVSNLWTRAIFSEQMGINDLPQNCAFFSAIDIDHVLRKEVDMDCITPSNKVSIPPGESIDITRLLTLSDSKLTNARTDVDVMNLPYQYREPVFSKHQRAYSKDFLNYFLRMQIQSAKWKVDELESDYLRHADEKDRKSEDEDYKYQFADYLNDTTKGKHTKMNIMAETPPISTSNLLDCGGKSTHSAEALKKEDEIEQAEEVLHPEVRSLEAQHLQASESGIVARKVSSRQKGRRSSPSRSSGYRIFNECIDLSRNAAERRQKQLVDKRLDVDSLVKEVLQGETGRSTRTKRSKPSYSAPIKRKETQWKKSSPKGTLERVPTSCIPATETRGS